ncbi:cisplatin damage response ATP-dependent DNA ligase [Fulvivirgaceae bacterium BMA10]|uniref:Cisplatin damage response ATP-dependent DNA ligase n=1 Tax=Splendidivirga corallicola TaxID=3051826 RepID=A0ABT8KY23_9BACT|nr:cisplatin damage response ATP-dependent DNA ligase [Fulvivirgaceae bacterium BMA10]
MERLAQLLDELDFETSDNTKIRKLSNYLEGVPDDEKLWAIALLSGRRPKRLVSLKQLRQWATELTGIEDWLFEESYNVVGDLTETISLILPKRVAKDSGSLTFWMKFIIDLKEHDPETKKQRIIEAWDRLGQYERLLFNRILVGGLRTVVSQKLLVTAISRNAQIEENVLAHRLMGEWDPEMSDYHSLILAERKEDKLSRPYPFLISKNLENNIELLGDPKDWIAERLFSGILVQLIIRQNQLFIWSNDNELITDKFPEFKQLINLFPDGTVMEGYMISYINNQPHSFGKLQSRITKKQISKRIVKDSPVVFIASDLLEYNEEDIRDKAFEKRRSHLEAVISKAPISELMALSELIEFKNWQDLEQERLQSRKYFGEGIFIKSRRKPCLPVEHGEERWSWKANPFTVNAVLLYVAQDIRSKHYTFAVWKGDELIPLAKTNIGLSTEEMKEIDEFVKDNTIEKFGPVRSIRPEMVYEIAFDAIDKSSRHKSGVVLYSPRILGKKENKLAQDANTLEDVTSLLTNN